MIDSLIDKQDNFEIVRDQIAAILVSESAAQQALATTAARDPREWAFKVYVDRSTPWADWINPPTKAQLDATPIVSVSLDSLTFDGSASNVSQRQMGTAVYQIDCLGYGVTQSDGSGGHIPGDQRALGEAQRTARLVRNILASDQYAYLALRGLVWSKQISSMQLYQPSETANSVQQVAGMRINFEVKFNEFSPQSAHETLESIYATVRREEDGEILLSATYDADDFQE